ncbi:MAG: glutamate--cysteine ligase [Mycobacteriaceae bacterium]|nr:glutamate--cysteine ligase [Mycobacteriaceae bacterium]
MGVEEEFLLVDPDSRTAAPAGARVVARAAPVLGESICAEFSQYQVEVKTRPCVEATQLREELVRLRSAAAAAAADEGVRIAATGTPISAGGEPLVVADHPRYHAGVRQYRAMLDDFVVGALHVHVHLPDRHTAVLVGNHVRVWLPLLVALSANSPFYRGRDTGYASWRTVIRSRFPCLGPPPYAESLQHHKQLAVAIASSEAMLDADTPFWDVRANPCLPTVEIRAMDVTVDVDAAVALAVLIRALVVTVAALVRGGDPGPRPCSELLRAACWRAARDGWSGSGVDVLTGDILPVPVHAERLVNHIRVALKDHGDFDVATTYLQRLHVDGTGADRQRACAARHGSLTAAVDEVIAQAAANRCEPGLANFADIASAAPDSGYDLRLRQ